PPWSCRPSGQASAPKTDTTQPDVGPVAGRCSVPVNESCSLQNPANPVSAGDNNGPGVESGAANCPYWHQTHGLTPPWGDRPAQPPSSTVCGHPPGTA